jgi:hypothetical protein
MVGLVMHGNAWKCMEMHGNAWKCMEMHGNAWLLHGLRERVNA